MKLEVGTQVTKTVSGFYTKMDRIVKMLGAKNHQATMKYKRFIQGTEILKKYEIDFTDETNCEEFIAKLNILIDSTLKTEESTEFIANLETFKDVMTFFDYV